MKDNMHLDTGIIIGEHFRYKKEEDWQYNPGYRFCDWYIKRKYSTLKKEILNKGLNIDRYNDTVIKAQNLYKNSSPPH